MLASGWFARQASAGSGPAEKWVLATEDTAELGVQARFLYKDVIKVIVARPV